MRAAEIKELYSENKKKLIENLRQDHRNLAERRNAIMDNPFKYYNPLYWSKLKEIEEELDRLDLEIYKIHITRCLK